jgi:hypothetical protein
MSRSSKLFLLVLLGGFVLACQALAKPVSVSESLELTAAAVGTQAVQMASQTAPFTPGVISSTVPGGGNIFDPQGAPASSWKEIPIMPQAAAGEDVEGVYSYRVLASMQDVQQFYAAQLPGLGWTTVLSAPDLPFLVYSKDDLELTITIADPDENGTIVLLAFQ